MEGASNRNTRVGTIRPQAIELSNSVRCGSRNCSPVPNPIRVTTRLPPHRRSARSWCGWTPSKPPTPALPPPKTSPQTGHGARRRPKGQGHGRIVGGCVLGVRASALRPQTRQRSPRNDLLARSVGSPAAVKTMPCVRALAANRLPRTAVSAKSNGRTTATTSPPPC